MMLQGFQMNGIAESPRFQHYTFMIEGKLEGLGGGQAQNREVLVNLIRHKTQ